MAVGDWLLHSNAARPINRKGRNSKAKREESSMSLKDVELVARAQDGDQTAFEALVRQYQGKAYAIAYNMGSGDSEEARELTQEAFLRAFTERSTPAKSRLPYRSSTGIWIFSSARALFILSFTAVTLRPMAINPCIACCPLLLR